MTEVCGGAGSVVALGVEHGGDAVEAAAVPGHPVLLRDGQHRLEGVDDSVDIAEDEPGGRQVDMGEDLVCEETFLGRPVLEQVDGGGSGVFRGCRVGTVGEPDQATCTVVVGFRAGEREQTGVDVAGGARIVDGLDGGGECGAGAGAVSEVGQALCFAAGQACESRAGGVQRHSGADILVGVGVAGGEPGDQALGTADPDGKAGVPGHVRAHQGAAGVGHGRAGFVEVEGGIGEDARKLAADQVEVAHLPGTASLLKYGEYLGAHVVGLGQHVFGRCGDRVDRQPRDVVGELLDKQGVHGRAADPLHERGGLPGGRGDQLAGEHLDTDSRRDTERHRTAGELCGRVRGGSVGSDGGGRRAFPVGCLVVQPETGAGDVQAAREPLEDGQRYHLPLAVTDLADMRLRHATRSSDLPLGGTGPFLESLQHRGHVALVKGLSHVRAVPQTGRCGG